MTRWVFVLLAAGSVALMQPGAAVAELLPEEGRLRTLYDYFSVPRLAQRETPPLSGDEWVAEVGQAPPSGGEFVSAEACDCWEPLWIVRASVVFMERSNAEVEGLSFDFDFEPGLDLSLIRSLGACHDIEFRYFGIHGWRSDIEVPFVSLYNRSELDSTEVNLRRRLGRLSLLAGFRWVEFMDESQLDAAFFFPISIGTNINNHLYGGQIGVDGTLWDNGCRLRLDSFLKAGVYYNHIDSTTFVSAGQVFVEFQDSVDRTAFVGELGLLGVYEWSDNWALRAGYQLLWLEGIALAPEQFGSLDTSGLFAHGAVIGVEFAY
jgi:hypothetical protein